MYFFYNFFMEPTADLLPSMVSDDVIFIVHVTDPF